MVQSSLSSLISSNSSLSILEMHLVSLQYGMTKGVTLGVSAAFLKTRSYCENVIT